uniref:Uncharacterized protein n=1 Tax=Canis lupus familiaris TaxID=9615 RepID=A0A8C0PCA3_CANLF
ARKIQEAQCFHASVPIRAEKPVTEHKAEACFLGVGVGGGGLPFHIGLCRLQVGKGRKIGMMVILLGAFQLLFSLHSLSPQNYTQTSYKAIL